MAPPANGDSVSGHQLAATYADRIKDKIILVTGTSQGSLGEEYCLAIAKFQPKILILAGRSADKVKYMSDAISKIDSKIATKFLELNLESLSAVKKAAETVNSWDDVPYIDVFCHNAAIMGTTHGVTTDGFERQLGINYLATWVFTNTILPNILKSQDPRVVLLGSDGHRWGPIRWNDHNFKVRDLAFIALQGNYRLTNSIITSYRVVKFTIDGVHTVNQKQQFTCMLSILVNYLERGHRYSASTLV